MTTSALAADHFDGPQTSDDPVGDIADFYVFPVEDGKGGTRLVLMLNTFPRAGKEAWFSDAITYGFRLRPSWLEKTDIGVATKVSDREFRLACNFDIDTADTEKLAMLATCTLSEGDRLVAVSTVPVDALGGGEAPSFKVFAGLRADPFFTDAIRIRLPRPRHDSLSRLISTGNSMRPAYSAVGVNAGGPRSTRREVPNVLSIVVDLDVKALLGDAGPTFAVVAETRRRERGVQ
ncbi:MAG: hypothetical protein ACE366_18695 [Bradymonadia bacterium]